MALVILAILIILTENYAYKSVNILKTNVYPQIHRTCQSSNKFVFKERGVRGVKGRLGRLKNVILDVPKRIQRRIYRPLPSMFSYIWPTADDEDDIEKGYPSGRRLSMYIGLSMLAMFAGKYFNLQVPFILQRAVDSIASQSATGKATNALKLSIAMYGFSRALTVVFSELKTCLFIHVSQCTLRKFANRIFTHLHSLDSDFHLKTPSGVVSFSYSSTSSKPNLTLY